MPRIKGQETFMALMDGLGYLKKVPPQYCQCIEMCHEDGSLLPEYMQPPSKPPTKFEVAERINSLDKCAYI